MNAKRIGKLQRQCRRAFWAANVSELQAIRGELYTTKVPVTSRLLSAARSGVGPIVLQKYFARLSA
jgi:hypothetical protein